MSSIMRARIAYYRAKRRHTNAVKFDEERWDLYQEGVRNGCLNGVDADEFMSETRNKRGETLLEYINAFDTFCNVKSATSIFLDPIYWLILLAFAVLGSVFGIFLWNC